MSVETKEIGGRRVVEKRLDPRLRRDPVARARLRSEGAWLARLQATGVVPRLVAHGEDAGGPFVVTEALDATFATLADRVARGGAFAVDPLAAFLALALVHEAGVVHADLSPANLAVADDGRVVLLDFGLAVGVDAPTDRDGAFVGTVGFAAPEVARGDGPTIASDLFSLAACLAFACTGRGPRVATTLAAAIVEAAETPIAPPPALPAVVAACLALDPGARPASARSVIAVLEPGA